MTIEKAIEVLENGEFWNILDPPCDNRADPLTLSELREMDGEPVWVVALAGSHIPTGWMLVVREWDCCKNSTGDVAFFDRNGEWWDAYRRKPEEGTK